MASFGIASNTSWSFFLDRDNGIFYEMLTYPMSRAQYLLGKVLFNVGDRRWSRRCVTVVLAALAARRAGRGSTGCRCWRRRSSSARRAGFSSTRFSRCAIRRNDAFNTVTSIFYFVFLFASSMFYPLEPLPRWFRVVALANPITWHVDVLRYATIGVGEQASILVEAAAFALFVLAGFALAIRSLEEA